MYTYGEWRLRVQQNAKNLLEVPSDFLTYDFCLASAFNNGMILEFIPKCFITIELYLAALENDGLAIKHIPLVDRTPVICLAAVNNNPGALPFVPNKNDTALQQNLWFQLIKMSEDAYHELEFPTEDQTNIYETVWNVKKSK